MNKEEEQDWLDSLRVSDGSIVGMWTNNDFALITDRDGFAWRTETLNDGEQVKIRANAKMIASIMGA